MDNEKTTNPDDASSALPTQPTPASQPSSPPSGDEFHGTPFVPNKETPTIPTTSVETTRLREEVGLSMGEEAKNDMAPKAPVPQPDLDDMRPSGVIQEDIARILAETKLPERKEFRASADTPIPTPEKVPPETANEKAAPAPSESVAGVVTPPTLEKKERNPVVPLHTLKDDLDYVVHSQNMSVVRAAALEEDKKARVAPHTQPEAPAQVVPHQRSVARSLLLALALTLLGGVLIGSVVFVMQQQASAPQAQFITEGLVFSEQTIPFPIDTSNPSELKRSLYAARVSQGLTLGAITRLVPIVTETHTETSTERLASLGEFLSAIDAHAPEELIRALSSEFFFGIHTVDENAPFIVAPVVSYERAFGAMLEWENTINGDLTPVFTAVPLLEREASGLLSQRVFTDATMRNYDVRVLKDDAGVIQLYYAFPTRDVLIIAENQYSFVEILSRLRAERRL